MIYFILNIFFAVGWMLVNASYGALDFLVGFAIGMLSLYLTQPFQKKTGYFKRFYAILALFAYFMYEMFASVVMISWDILTPGYFSKPRIVYVPLDVRSDFEITLLANMVSLTPGSLCLDVTEDKKHMIIHAMFADSEEQVITTIKNGLEKRLLKVRHG